MIEDSRIEEYISLFQELSELGGNAEKTSIFPNLEVIDSAPASLSTDYIIIKDDNGYYIPALKVPGLTYSDGDFVNVIFIKGTEPIAFQHGTSSSGGAVTDIDESLLFLLMGA